MEKGNKKHSPNMSKLEERHEFGLSFEYAKFWDLGQI
jgi:hypothetical protein